MIVWTRLYSSVHFFIWWSIKIKYINIDRFFCNTFISFSISDSLYSLFSSVYFYIWWSIKTKYINIRPFFYIYFHIYIFPIQTIYISYNSLYCIIGPVLLIFQQSNKDNLQCKHTRSHIWISGTQRVNNKYIYIIYFHGYEYSNTSGTSIPKSAGTSMPGYETSCIHIYVVK